MGVRLSSKSDYAVRAMAELAAHALELPPHHVGEGHSARPRRAEDIAGSQDIPLKFLLAILGELKQAQLVRSRRGPDGGYLLARPAKDITIADVLRATDGPLVTFHDASLRELSYDGAAEELPVIWMAVRAALRDVLDQTTLADLVNGKLPKHVRALAATYQSSLTGD